MVPARTMRIPLPLGGIDQGAPFEEQRPGTSPALINCRPFDAATERGRLAQRPGLSKAVDDQVDGGGPIQAVAGIRVQQTRERLDAGTVQFTDDFNRADTAVNSLGDGTGGGSDDWVLYEGSTPGFNPANSEFRVLGTAGSATWLGTGTPGPEVDSNAYRDQLETQSTSGSPNEQFVIARLDRGDTGESLPSGGFGLEIEFATQASLNENAFLIGLWCYGSATESDFLAQTDGALFCGIEGRYSNSNNVVRLLHAVNIAGQSGVDQWTGNAGVPTPSSQQPTPDGRLQTGLLDGSAGIGFDGGVSYFSTSTTYTLRMLVRERYFELYLKEGAGSFQLVSFGELREECDPENPEFGFWVRNVGGDASKHFLASVDNFRIYPLSAKALLAPEDKIIAVEGGEVFVSVDGAAFTQASDQPETLQTTGEITAIVGPPLPSEPVDVRYVYFLDGARYQRLDVFEEVVSEWEATEGEGVLPGSEELSAKYAVNWRNRCVMFGLDSDQTNWYMSRVGDWGNWNYTPATPDGAQAIAGSAEGQVRNVEAITAMIPYTADYLIMAGLTSIQMFYGDPADGGQINLLTSRSGVVGPRAWAMDPSGVVYFMGPDGLYSMIPPSTEPQPLSHGRIDPLLRGIDLPSADVRLVYDTRNDGLHIFIDPETGDNLILWWDRRSGRLSQTGFALGSFWRDTFADSDHFPTCAAFFGYAASGANLSSALLGQSDGYIRSFDNSAKDDDGTAIDSTGSLLGPVVAPAGDVIRFSELRLRAGDNNERLVVGIRVGETCEIAHDATPQATRTYTEAGLLTPFRRYARGSCMYIDVGQDQADDRWSLESVEVTAQNAGLVRRGNR